MEISRGNQSKESACLSYMELARIVYDKEAGKLIDEDKEASELINELTWNQDASHVHDCEDGKHTAKLLWMEKNQTSDYYDNMNSDMFMRETCTKFLTRISNK